MKKLISMIAIVALSSNVMITKAAEISTYTEEKKQIGNSDNVDDYEFSFDEEIEKDGVKYKLDHFEYAIENLYEKEYGSTVIAEQITQNEVITANEKDSYHAKPTIEQDGFIYDLESTKIEVKKENMMELSAYVDTEITNVTFSEVQYEPTYTYSCEYGEYELPYTRYEVMNEGWHSGYQFSGTITDYDAATYQIGNIIIESDRLEQMSASELQQMMMQFGYSPEYYRAESFSFTSEPYEVNGMICRDYKVNASVYGNSYRLWYEDVLDMSELEVINTYELPKDMLEQISNLKGQYEVSAKAFYVEKTKKSNTGTVKKIVIGTMVLIAIILFIALIIYLIRGGRKPTEYKSKRDIREDYKNL